MHPLDSPSPHPAHRNRLAAEASPYLLQHASNPVDWHPWGPEALELARSEDRPIFLSVGYSTCYWCHVMERQCFESPPIAAEMNRRFINIKVDREERPDIDQLYMTAVQFMARQGGWPMSVFLTPDLRPFFGGTYFPPQDAHGRPGFPRILAAVEDAYRNRQSDVNESADQIVRALKKMSRPQPPSQPFTLDEAWIDRMIARSTTDFDEVLGGFGSAPKFPRQTLLELILRKLATREDKALRRMLNVSLDAMMHGGIRDHLGGAFHRYSTDAQWLVPHFEIMLYDNAMLLWIYAEAYSQTKDPRYAAVARSIAKFVRDQMTSPAGGFYTALDAEVDAAEGANYLWTRDQVRDALAGAVSEEEIARFLRVYGLDEGPNFADPHQGNGIPDSNVLFLFEPGEGASSALLDANLSKARQILHAARQQRKQPRLDNKVLTSWNGLMIRGMAHAGKILADPELIAAAANAADYLLQSHREPESKAAGGLLRSSVNGIAKHPDFLDDYAFLAQALLALAEAGGGEKRRRQAQELAAEMKQKFYAPGTGGFFYTQEGAGDLIVRQMAGTDSPLPSGNGIAAQVLLHLGDTKPARVTVEIFAGHMQSMGEGMSALVQAAMECVTKTGNIEVQAGTPGGENRPPSPEQLAEQAMDLSGTWIDDRSLELVCVIASGSHVNASDARQPLVGLQVIAATEAASMVESIEYPPGTKKHLEFAEGDAISIYEGEVRVVIRLKQPLRAQAELPLTVVYQPCDDRACLPIVRRRLLVRAG
jgi:uncharacterized protein YyaL (SSP411 family)